MVGNTYSVTEFAQLAGVTVRTLHHYEAKGLLVPARRANGYRAYTSDDAARLQRILLYRACGMPLDDIAKALERDGDDELDALARQHELLEERRQAIEDALRLVERTMDALSNGGTMEDFERFEGLKRKAVDDNERAYGAEARERWGDEAVDAANERLLAMDEEEWDGKEQLEGAIIDQLKVALATGDPAGAEAQQLAAMHARWIRMHWGETAYSPAAHASLAQGYLADERFVAYYDDRAGEGATAFLAKAVETSGV